MKLKCKLFGGTWYNVWIKSHFIICVKHRYLAGHFGNLSMKSLFTHIVCFSSIMNDKTISSTWKICTKRQLQYLVIDHIKVTGFLGASFCPIPLNVFTMNSWAGVKCWPASAVSVAHLWALPPRHRTVPVELPLLLLPRIRRLERTRR